MKKTKETKPVQSLQSYVQEHCQLNGPITYFTKLYLTPFAHLAFQELPYECLKEAYIYVTVTDSDTYWADTRLGQFNGFMEAIIRIYGKEEIPRSEHFIKISEMYSGHMSVLDFIYRPNERLYHDLYQYIYEKYRYDIPTLHEQFVSATKLADRLMTEEEQRVALFKLNKASNQK